MNDLRLLAGVADSCAYLFKAALSIKVLAL